MDYNTDNNTGGNVRAGTPTNGKQHLVVRKKLDTFLARS